MSSRNVRNGLLGERLKSYQLIVLLGFLGALVFNLRSEGIFSCPAEGYAGGTYLGYCSANKYGDYDHGAFWFKLEPRAASFATAAEVLFLGNSRMQFAFSTAATTEWFDSLRASYYLLGFTHSEGMAFTKPLLSRLGGRPRARVYIINADRFFVGEPSRPARYILTNDDAKSVYKQKRLWQLIHRLVCTITGPICGTEFSIFRATETGAWQIDGRASFKSGKVTFGETASKELWPEYFQLAQQFLSDLHVEKSCIFFTLAPYEGTRIAEGTAIADAVGVDLIAPRLTGLNLFDGIHMDPSSAERWSRSFFEAAGPRIKKCLH